MPDNTTIGIFNDYVRKFNDAVVNNDVDKIADLGTKMIHIALEELSNSNLPSSLASVYVKQAETVLRHMEKAIKSAICQPKVTQSYENENSSDPYYTTKQWFSDEVPNLNFSNIVGVQEVKDSFMVDVVAPLSKEFKAVYKKFRGNQLGVNLLLFGPPGTGKTHIVKCLAGALNCKIAVVQTSEVLASVVGVAEKNMRDIFEQASKLDRCIIFLDEIDALCSDRLSDDSRHTKSILTTMLTCMDGFIKTTKPGQFRIIVAATNLPWRLDAALKRGGRFEKQIYVPLPDYDARVEFVEMDLNHIPHDTNVTSKWLAQKLQGYSGADIKAIMKQIANRPLRREVMNIYNKQIGKELGERITVGDCEEVINSYINSVSPEMIMQYEAYNLGMSYENYLSYINKLNISSEKDTSNSAKESNADTSTNYKDQLINEMRDVLMKLLGSIGDDING